MREAQVETEIQSIFQPGVDISTRVEARATTRAVHCGDSADGPIPMNPKSREQSGLVPEQAKGSPQEKHPSCGHTPVRLLEFRSEVGVCVQEIPISTQAR